MKLRLTLFAFITIFAFVFNCGKSDETYTIETIEGVRHVHNHAPLWGDEPKVALEFVQKIGDLETTDENYQLFGSRDVAVDSQGNIYVLDSGNFRIQKFTPEGKYLKSFGRRGQGPSEFLKPEAIKIDNNGNIFVSDRSLNRIIILNPNGKEITRIPFSSNTMGGLSSFLVLRSGNIAKYVYFSTGLIAIFDQTGTLLEEYGEKKVYKTKDIRGYSSDFNVEMNGVDYANDAHDNIYMSFHCQNRLEKYSPEGELIFRADRKLGYDETKKEKFKKRITKSASGRERVRLEPDINYISYGIEIDGLGRIWCSTSLTQSERSQFEIFNSDGILLGYIPIPEDFSSSYRIFGDRIFTTWPIIYMCVYEYKIVEK